MRRFFLLFLGIVFFFSAAESSPLPVVYNGASLKVLNKVSARVHTLNVATSGKAVVGHLIINVLSCTQMPPGEEPQTAAYIQVYVRPSLDFDGSPSSLRRQYRKEDDSGPDQALPIFSGFIYAETPSLNGLENPFYDIWLHSCRGLKE